jgi:UDP-N-acetylglucosamine 2-epimerase (non-hydrolysing)
MILICFGTRPEWLKIKPLIKVLDNYSLLFTGQHPDLLPQLLYKNNDISSCTIFEEGLSGVKIDYEIIISDCNNRLDQIVNASLSQFPDGDFNSVLVQGDTASAFGCALAAFHRNKKIYYLEAGLRTYDLDHPFPEEGYRQMISRLADVNFCPTILSKENLVNEKVKGDCYSVGNTVLDNLLPYKEKCEYSNKILVTLHRRENHHWMKEWFIEINNLAKDNPDMEFILPIHPNPNVSKHRHVLTHVNVMDPLPYHGLLNILVKCKLVISDSGGLQEEGSFFNKKVVVCRKTTERPEGISTGHLSLCMRPMDLPDEFNRLIDNYYINVKCPYGDGMSSLKVKGLIEHSFQ